MPEKSETKTRELVYTGEAPARLIAIPGGSIRVERGKPFTAPEPLATSLLEQDIFDPAPKRTSQEKQ